MIEDVKNQTSSITVLLAGAFNANVGGFRPEVLLMVDGHNSAVPES